MTRSKGKGWCEDENYDDEEESAVCTFPLPCIRLCAAPLLLLLLLLLLSSFHLPFLLIILPFLLLFPFPKNDAV